MAYHPGKEIQTMKARLKLNRMAVAPLLCSAMFAFTAGNAAAQTQPAPAAAPAATPAPAVAPTAAQPASDQATPTAATPVQGTSTLTIKIKGIRNAKGKIDVALYGSDKGFPLDPSSAVGMKQVDVDAKTMTATVIFEKLPQGNYAATVMHDENLVGKMEFDASGVPLEGYGISNNPDSSQGPPNWDDSKFAVNKTDAAIEISMIYWQ
jgi:uncharacterized protein (DUF2141 family)